MTAVASLAHGWFRGRPTITDFPAPGPEPLTAAEIRVLNAIAKGLPNRDAAEELYISIRTVDFHLRNIYRKLSVRNRYQLAMRLSALGFGS